MLNIIRIRQSITSLIFISAVLAILLALTGVIDIFGLRDDSYPYINAVLSVILPTTATFGIAAIAIVFLTAQVSVAYGKPSVLRELYRSWDVYILFSFILANVFGGYALLVLNANLPVSILETKLLDCILITGLTTTFLVLPTMMSQIENLDPLTLASKLSARISPTQIRGYGLTEIESGGSEQKVLSYRLVTAGLRPAGVDPFRPMHEIIMDAVVSRDRVLFGKLFRNFLSPIARIHHAPRWKKYSPPDQVHVTLATMHYAVKRARNLIKEWNGLDIGRHGILTGICDLIRSLARVEGSDISIRICLFAVLHIEGFYSEIAPYGRVEPLNAYFEVAQDLHDLNKLEECHLCLAILAWANVHTAHTSEFRSPSIETTLSSILRSEYVSIRKYFLENPVPTPYISDDPWRDWPGS